MFGTITIVDNKNQHKTASESYNAICIYNELGVYETLLLTENDLERIRKRAEKNPEDAISLPWLTITILRILRFLKIV